MMNSSYDCKPIEGIRCDAENCIHHASDGSCCAGEIKVGYHSACACSDTACTTFCQKKDQ